MLEWAGDWWYVRVVMDGKLIWLGQQVASGWACCWDVQWTAVHGTLPVAVGHQNRACHLHISQTPRRRTRLHPLCYLNINSTVASTSTRQIPVGCFAIRHTKLTRCHLRTGHTSDVLLTYVIRSWADRLSSPLFVVSAAFSSTSLIFWTVRCYCRMSNRHRYPTCNGNCFFASVFIAE